MTTHHFSGLGAPFVRSKGTVSGGVFNLGASGYNTSQNETRNKGAFVMDAASMDLERLLSRSQSLAQAKKKDGDR